MDDTIIVGPLYEARKKVLSAGRPRQVSSDQMDAPRATLTLYYLLPFARWDRGPGLPSQAVLVDFPHRRFYFFFIELWPQEVYYFTGLLIIAAMTLFLMNAVAGRLPPRYVHQARRSEDSQPVAIQPCQNIKTVQFALAHQHHAHRNDSLQSPQRDQKLTSELCSVLTF